MNSEVLHSAARLRDLLVGQGRKIVFAESCTAGRLAASLGCIPGISSVLCGSFVVYRNASKQQWLGIAADLLDDPAVGPVSQQVTQLLAENSLNRTAEADVALAITGEIGPSSEPSMSGKIYCSALLRSSGNSWHREFQLSLPGPVDERDIAARNARLDEASQLALNGLCDFLFQCP
ncbi:MAG: CinA family protein [bacterium]|nr:CinA family protein [bacterium]